MSTYEPTEVEGTDLETRDVRALEEYLTVLEDGGRVAGAEDLYLVVSQSGSEYLVDVRQGTCECPDHKHRGAECKHLRRVAIATGERPIPVDVLQAADVDPNLGEHVAGPAVLASDGGIIQAGDEGEILDEDEDDEDGAECDCANLPDGVPCWPCYRDGATFDR